MTFYWEKLEKEKVGMGLHQVDPSQFRRAIRAAVGDKTFMQLFSILSETPQEITISCCHTSYHKLIKDNYRDLIYSLTSKPVMISTPFVIEPL